MLQEAKYGLQYALEAGLNARNLAKSLRNVSLDRQVSDFLSHNRIYPSSAMGLLGLVFYDMSVDQGVCEDRKLVEKNSSRIIQLIDIADDVIDERPSSLEDKFRFLDRAKSDLFGRSANTSQDLQERAVYALAQAIYSGVLFRDHNKRMEKVIDGLISAVKRQFSATDNEELLGIAKTIGSSCTDCAAVLTEIVTGKEYPKTREAARRIGEYCEFLDNIYEIDEDLTEGLNTYPTARIKKEGDSPALRKEIKRHMLMLAQESFEEGLARLYTKKQQVLYNMLRRMFDIKYKILDRLKHI